MAIPATVINQFAEQIFCDACLEFTMSGASPNATGAHAKSQCNKSCRAVYGATHLSIHSPASQLLCGQTGRNGGEKIAAVKWLENLPVLFLRVLFFLSDRRWNSIILSINYVHHPIFWGFRNYLPISHWNCVVYRTIAKGGEIVL